MKYPLFLVGLLFACVDSSEQEKQEVLEEEERREGTQQGDCSDGVDNDNDGDLDCEDAGCIDKPAIRAVARATVHPLPVRSAPSHLAIGWAVYLAAAPSSRSPPGGRRT